MKTANTAVTTQKSPEPVQHTDEARKARENAMPALRVSLSESLSQRVLDLIKVEGLGAGDRLPSVRAMAELFSVAPPTLREALRRLQTTGIVELRHGSGVYVRHDQERMVFANPNRTELDAATILDLLDARLLIEPYLIALTAKRLAGPQLQELEAYLDEAQDYLDGSSDAQLQRVNMAFHCGIARFSGNRVLSQSLESLIELYSAEQKAIQTVYDDRRGDYAEHRQILASLKKGNAAQSTKLMHAHLGGVRSTVKEALPRG